MALEEKDNADESGLVLKEKDKADVLLRLHDTAWANFERRRAYEWKLSLAIWTAIAAFIAICLRKCNVPSVNC